MDANRNVPALSDFENCVGEAFVFHLENGPRNGTLEKVVALDDKPTPGGTVPYSLEFLLEGTFEQGTFNLEHSKLGSLDIFLVPVAPGRLQAIFS